MENYEIKIECDLLNDMGFLVNHILSFRTSFEPRIGDVYALIKPKNSKIISVQVTDIVNKLIENELHHVLYCYGEEIDDVPFVTHTYEYTKVA
jgi:hypothetical protein